MDPITWAAVLKFASKFWRESIILSLLLTIGGQYACKERSINKMEKKVANVEKDFSQYKIEKETKIAALVETNKNLNRTFAAINAGMEELGSNFDEFSAELDVVRESIQDAEDAQALISDFLAGQPVPEDCNEAIVWFYRQLPFVLGDVALPEDPEHD